MYKQNSEELQKSIKQYFDGIFYGDIKKLKNIFHPKSILVGDINGDPYFKNVDDYLEGVKNRKSPKELGESNKMKTISLEILNNIAYAKLHVPMFEYNYYDYVAFSKTDGKWSIVNKVFTHVA